MVIPQATTVAVPNPDGLTLEQATALLQSAGFQVVVARTGPKDRVWFYTPSGQQPPGTDIELFVGY